MSGHPDDRMPGGFGPLSRAETSAPSRVLDREAPLPLYFQLRDAILGDISDRGLRPGDRLPTEAELQRRYGVSRATIRQALAELASEGLIRTVHGVGTFVAEPKIRHVPLLTSFTELLNSQGFQPSHRVLASTLAGAPPDVAADLGLAPGTICRHLRRLMLSDGTVIGLAETWLPHDVLGGNDELFEQGRLGEGSLYALLQSPPVGLALHRAVESISPGVANAEGAGLLGCPPGTPVLSIRRISFTHDERPVERTSLLFMGDRYEYRVELYRPEAGR